MGPKTQRLIVVLQEMAEILAANARPEWAQWIKRATIQLLNSDYHGVETVLAAYGGMGSLNDVVLAQITAGPLSVSAIGASADEVFADLRDEAWRLANEIKQGQTK